MDITQIYESIRCSKCKHRLKEPYELKCKHLICRDCLSTILHNHRTNSRCPICNKSLDEYQIENYSFLPVKHPINKLLSSFTDVNQCKTCQDFTTVEACLQCCKDQCENCRDKHEETHHQQQKQANKSIDFQFDDLSQEEMKILEAIKKELTEQEFEDLVIVARTYLNSAISKSNISNEITTISEKTSFYTEEKIYDWSKHPKFTADDIPTSSPERVKELLRLGFTPRPYQIRMIRFGLQKRNSLVCLQTGAGKTYVAGLLAKFFYIHSLPAVNPSSSRRFKAVFLVPIKALVDQQCEAYRRVFIDQPDSILKTIDSQAGERFEHLYPQFHIFFFTVQKFANFIESKYADLNKFDLIIIDECHHCYDNHPINSMMRQYHRLKQLGSHVPQIIALTGSVGTNKKNAFNHLVHLCANLDCLDICAIERGPEEDELRQSTNTPLADTIVTVCKEENDPIISKLKDDVMRSIASRLGYDITIMDNQKLEQFLVDKNQKAATTNDHDAIIGTDYLRKLNRFLLFYDDLPLKQCMQWLDENLEGTNATKRIPFDNFCWKKLNEFRQFAQMKILNPGPIKIKLRKLIDMIINLHTPNSRGLVLVRTKFHTVALEEFLNNQPELKENHIFVGHLTGQGSADEFGLPGTQQATVLKEFRKGTKNLLVATDVAQEGIDVAECSYVIRYEFVSNEIGSVQSRGRARAAQSKCFLLTETLSLNFQRENENRLREIEMKEAIDEWRRRGPEEFERLVRKEQKDLSTTNDSPQIASSPFSISCQAAKAIHCRFCNTYLCKGSSLRRQGSTVVCIDPTFEATIKPPKVNGEKILCSEAACHREIGAVILLQRNMPGYVLQITALKFYFSNETEPKIFKKWSSYCGEIQSL